MGLRGRRAGSGERSSVPPAGHVGQRQNGTAGLALDDSIVARVTDAEGRAVPGVLVTFVAADGDGDFAPASRLTDEEGEAQALWTLGGRSGTQSARIDAEDLVPAPLSAIAAPAAAARLAFESVPAAAVAGIVLSPPVVVAVQDRYGNLVPTSSTDIQLHLSRGTLVGAGPGSAVGGRATFGGLHIDEPGTGYVLSASAEGLTGTQTEPFPVATGTAAELLAAAGDGQEAAAGSPVAISPEVLVRDADGNGIAGVSVTFTVTNGGGSVAPGSVVTGSNGRAAPDGWTLGTAAGANTMRASAAALPGASVDFNAEAVPGPVDPSRSTMSVTPPTVVTGAMSVVEVTALDAFGNPVQSAVVALTASGAGNTLVQPPPTGADGKAAGSLRSTTAGSKTVSAVIGGVVLAQNASVLVENPPPVAAVEVSPRETELLVTQTTPLVATAFDAQGQPIDGAVVTWNSSDPDVARIDAQGIVTARAVGGATITATSGGKSGTAQISVSHGEGTLTGITYCTIAGVEVKMDVYVPADSKPRPLPVVVHVHGGGWVGGNRSTGSRFVEMKPVLLDRGYLVVSLDYRLAPAHKYPAQIQDVKCAIRHLRGRAAEYGLDPDRIGAWGGSAGGQLVALLGSADAAIGFDGVGEFQGISSEVQAVIAISAITDFTSPDELRDNYSRAFRTWPDPTSPEMIEASPVTHVSADDPPFFFIVGDEDDLVLPAQSVRMHQRLRDAGVPSSLLRVLHAGHSLEPVSGPIDPSPETITTRVAAFLDQHLR